MAIVAVLADPPVPGHVLPELTGSALSEEEAARLYRAMLIDVCRTVQDGGADLLINYRAAEDTPISDPETRLRDALGDQLSEPGEARYEVQVGETFAGRVGNTVTHLLEEEGEKQVVAATPGVPFLRRDHVGGLGMALRSNDVVIAPAPGGRVALAGFTEPIAFADAYDPPAVETLTARACDAGLSVDFLARLPLVETPADLADAVADARARVRADRIVPSATVEMVQNLGLRAVDGSEGLTVERG